MAWGDSCGVSFWSFLRPPPLDPKLKVVGSTVIFQNCNRQELETLKLYLHERHYLAGEIVFDEGEEGEGVYIVVSGKFRATRKGMLKKKNLGEILPGEGGDLHPRSALGLDPTGRWLTWLVVDGRQKGDSEGVSERELAGLMQEVGCREAFNLDGGGSSILLLGRPDERLEILNRPSDTLGPRPVPVMLGIRRR